MTGPMLESCSKMLKLTRDARGIYLSEEKLDSAVFVSKCQAQVQISSCNPRTKCNPLCIYTKDSGNEFHPCSKIKATGQ